MHNTKNSKYRSKIQVKTIPKLAYFKRSLKGQKLPNDKDLEFLFAHELVRGDKSKIC